MAIILTYPYVVQTDTAEGDVLHETDYNAILANLQDLLDELGSGPKGSAGDLTTRLTNALSLNVKDYGAIGDGVIDDSEAFLNAVAALPSGGGTVFIPQGNYVVNFSTYLATGQANITFMGCGQGSKITIANGSNYPAVYFENCDNLTISDIQIDGNMDNQTGLWHASGILVQNSNNVCIKRCTVLDTYSHAIALRGCTKSSISNCFVKNSGLGGEGGVASHGIDIDKSNTADCKGIKIFGNIVGNVSYGSIKMERIVDGHIYSNYIYRDDTNYKATGIAVAADIGEETYLRSIIISNNIQHKVRLAAVRVASGLVVTNNLIRNSGMDEGMWISECEGALIEGNIVSASDGSGIVLQDSQVCKIADNIIRNCGQDIGVHGARAIYIRYVSTTPEYNLITGNFCIDNQGVPTQTHGIYESTNCSNNRYEGNYLIGNINTPEWYGSNGKYWELDVIHWANLNDQQVDYVHAAITGTGSEQEITTGITNPDVGRGVSITTTNNASPSGDVIIDGVNALGLSDSEAITIAAGSTAFSNIPFLSVSKITIPAGVTAADTVKVGIGIKLGIPSPITDVAGSMNDIVKSKQNQADTNPNNISATGNWVSFTITDHDDITVWYRRRLNKQAFA